MINYNDSAHIRLLHSHNHHHQHAVAKTEAILVISFWQGKDAYADYFSFFFFVRLRNVALWRAYLLAWRFNSPLQKSSIKWRNTERDRFRGRRERDTLTKAGNILFDVDKFTNSIYSACDLEKVLNKTWD